MENGNLGSVAMSAQLKAYLLAQDPTDLKRRIEWFHTRALNGIGSGNFGNEISRVLGVQGNRSYVLPTSIQPIPAGYSFYRARILGHPDEIETQDNVWEAPEGKSSPGRLNRQGESLLYTSLSSPQTAALEVGVSKGKMFSMAEFTSIFTINATAITQPISDPFLPMRIRKNLELVTCFLDDIFMQKYAQRDAHDYTATHALVNELFYYPSELQQGWMHKSVADPKPLARNVCLRPAEAHTYLGLKEVTISICLDVDPVAGTMKAQMIRRLRPRGTRKFEEAPVGF